MKQKINIAKSVCIYLIISLVQIIKQINYEKSILFINWGG